LQNDGGDCLGSYRKEASAIHIDDASEIHVLKANNNLKNKSKKSMEPKISKRFSFVHVAKLRQMMMLTKGKTLKGCRVFPKDASFSLFSPEK